MAAEAKKRGLPPAAAGDGLARRVRPEEPQLRRRATPSASSRCASGSGTRAPTPAIPTSPSCRSSGSSTRPRRSRRSGSRAGKSIDDPNQFGDWIADVERPAEQYRGRYQLRSTRPRAAGSAASAGAADARAGRAVGRRCAEPQGRRRRSTRRQFGSEGTGGAPDAEALALLQQQERRPRRRRAVSDIKAGRIDPRVVARAHQAQPGPQAARSSCMCSDHPTYHHRRLRSPTTRSGAGSTSPRSTARSSGRAARWRARWRPLVLRGGLDPEDPRRTRSARRSRSTAPGYFTDAAHQNHIHLGFKTEIDAELQAAPPTSPPPRRPSARRSRRWSDAGRGRAGWRGRRLARRRGAAHRPDPARGARDRELQHAARRSTSTSRRRGSRRGTRGARRS